MTVQLPKTWELPAEVTTAFGGRVQEQRVLSQAGHLVLVVHHAIARRGADVPVVFWRNPKGEWRGTDGGKALPALHALVDNYAAEVEAIEMRLVKAGVAKDFFEVLAAVRPLEHRASEMTIVFERACRLVPTDADLERVWMRVRSIGRNLQLLVLRAEDGRDFDLAQLNEEQADISNQMVVSGQRLNFLIAMLLPMTALASVFGMNLFSGVEEGASSLLFWAVVLLSVVTGGLLSFFIGRMPRQLRRESHLEALVAEYETRRR
jgi:hypothetical protein